jgi:hypothetical protein
MRIKTFLLAILSRIDLFNDRLRNGYYWLRIKSWLSKVRSSMGADLLPRALLLACTVAIAVACGFYSLSAYRTYTLETEADRICRAYLSGRRFYGSQPEKDWLALRRCVTDAVYGAHYPSFP